MGNTLISQLKLMSKLFFIMGIPYVFDIVSTVIEYNYGKGDKFEYILTLDILNLLSGVIIFIVLCCKKVVVRKLLKKLDLNSTRQDSMQSEKTQDESIYLRKFSTFSNQSSISTVSNKTAHSEMVISEEEETDNADLDKQTTKTV